MENFRVAELAEMDGGHVEVVLMLALVEDRDCGQEGDGAAAGASELGGAAVGGAGFADDFAGADGGLVNEELTTAIAELARMTTPESNLRRISAIFTARQQMMEFNVPPPLALESMMVALKV